MTHCCDIYTACCLRCKVRKYLNRKKKAMLGTKLNCCLRCLICLVRHCLCALCIWFCRNRIVKFITKMICFSLFAFIFIYILLIVIILHLKINFVWGMVISIVLGGLLTVAMHDYSTIRVFVFLALPQVLSKYGRRALLMYCFILIILGPCKNILTNIGIMTHTLACIQAHLKEELAKLKKLLLQPMLEMKEVAKKLLKAIQERFESTMKIVRRIESAIMVIVNAFETIGKWLHEHLNLCNSVLGTPFDRCVKAITEANENCKKTYAAVLCNIELVVEPLCYTLKTVDLFCAIIDVIETGINDMVDALKRGIKKIEDFFYVDIDIKDNIISSVKTSEEPVVVMKRVLKGIKEDILRSISWLSWLGSSTLIILMCLLIRILWYRSKFLTKDRFDNFYITKELVNYDLQLAKNSKPTLLPLKNFEKSRYVRITSCFLNGREKFGLLKNISFMLFSSFKICIFLLLDYFIFWIINGIYLDKIFDETKSAFDYSGMNVNVDGEGYIIDFYKDLMHQIFKFKYTLSSASFKSCLSEPSRPNYDLYMHIGVILSICWFSIFMDPYILRLRNRVMSRMHPNRAKERMLWLHQKILFERDTLFTKAYRDLKHTLNKTPTERVTKETWKEFAMRFLLPARVYGWIKSGGPAECMKCRSKKVLKFCSTFKCPGVFCAECWSLFKNECPVCNEVESDMSEEVDSEDEEAYKKKMEKCKMKCKEMMRRRGMGSLGEPSTSQFAGDFQQRTLFRGIGAGENIDIIIEGDERLLESEKDGVLTREMSIVYEGNTLQDVVMEEDMDQRSMMTIGELELEIDSEVVKNQDVFVEFVKDAVDGENFEFKED